MTTSDSASQSDQHDSHTGEHVRSLSVWDAASIIIGVVVGVSIFRTPNLIFANVESAWMGLGLWLLGGILALVGALCYSELTTTYPESGGGDAIYLRRAFGPLVGFLFAWGNLLVVLTGSIAAMAYVFAEFAAQAFQMNMETQQGQVTMMAAGGVLAITAINALGVTAGKWVQNVLTILKVISLAAIVIAGVMLSGSVENPFDTSHVQRGSGNIGLAMVFVLYAYGGWNDAAFIAADVKHPGRNLPLALILSIIGITAIYMLVNGAYVLALGFEGAQGTFLPAGEMLSRLAGPTAGRVMSAIVAASALGALNALVLTGSRLFAALGTEHRLFGYMADWSDKKGAPIHSLVVQCAMALLLIALVGTAAGRNGLDSLLTTMGLASVPWDKYFGGFESLVAGSAPVFWAFFLMTGISVFVLRLRDKDRERPYKIPLYPLTPIVFCCMCGYMLYSSLLYAQWLCLMGVVPTLLGIPVYFLGRRR